MSLQLYIGNKNYSSWSMRPWVLMRQLGIPFEEIKLRFDFSDDSEFRRTVALVSPAGRVPVLVDDGFSVWDTLAIAEYLHERHPSLGVWPSDTRSRARARSLCAEMHAGFMSLRHHCPMNIEAHLPEVGNKLWTEQPDLRSDVERIDRMWSEQLSAIGGPMLFGAFSVVDAFFAPVCSRISTYGLPVSDACAAYMQRLVRLPSLQAWYQAAAAEQDFLPFEEPYRLGPERTEDPHQMLSSDA